MTVRDYCKKLSHNPYFYLLLVELGYIMLCEWVHAQASNPTPPHIRFWQAFGTDYNIANSCLGGAIVALVLAPFRRREFRTILTIGLILEAWRWMHAEPGTTFLGNVCLMGPMLFLATTLGLIVCLIRDFTRRSPEAMRTVEVFTLSTALIAVLYCSYLPTSSNSAPVYDPLLMAADGTWGCQPAFLISAALSKIPWLTSTMIFIYVFLPTWMLISQTLVYKHTAEHPWLAPYVPAFAFAVIAILGVSAYQFYPAIGTQAYCGTAIYPDGPIPTLPEHPQAVMAPCSIVRNAMPSLHLSNIICCLLPLFSLKRRYWILYAVLTIGTLLSAFQVGNHWMCDFVVALPFVAGCIATVASRMVARLRWTIALGGLTYSLVLMSILKYNIEFVLQHTGAFWTIALSGDVLALLAFWALVSPRFAQPHNER